MLHLAVLHLAVLHLVVLHLVVLNYIVKVTVNVYILLIYLPIIRYFICVYVSMCMGDIQDTGKNWTLSSIIYKPEYKARIFI